MSLAYLVRISGQSLDDLGLQLVAPAPALDYAGVARGRVGLIGALGTVPDPMAVGRPKEITLNLVATSTIADRQAALNALLARLDGLVELRFGWADDIAWWAYLDGVQIRARWDSVSFVYGDVVAECVFTVPDGTGRGPGQVLGVGSTATPVVGLGPLPSAPLYIIDGEATNPKITYRSADGVVRSELALTGTLTSDQSLEIDAGTSRVVKVTISTGARVLDMSYLAVGAGSIPIPDPGDGVGTSPPTLEVNSGSLTAYYTPRYPA